jgi:hypothetical protein
MNIFYSLKVNRKLDENGHTILEMSQQRFFKNIEEADSSLNTLWTIPITIVTNKSFPKIYKEVLMTEQTMQVYLGDSIGNDDMVYLNAENVGFYRVEYSKEMFERICAEIGGGKNLFGSSLDRFGFVSDTFALVDYYFL